MPGDVEVVKTFYFPYLRSGALRYCWDKVLHFRQIFQSVTGGTRVSVGINGDINRKNFILLGKRVVTPKING